MQVYLQWKGNINACKMSWGYKRKELQVLQQNLFGEWDSVKENVEKEDTHMKVLFVKIKAPWGKPSGWKTTNSTRQDQSQFEVGLTEYLYFVMVSTIGNFAEM